MKRCTRIFASGLALALLTLASPTRADEGDSIVESKKVTEGLVVLGGTTYQVRDGTSIEDTAGKAISLAQVPTLETGASDDEAAVYYEASEGDFTTPVLHRLKLMGSIPR